MIPTLALPNKVVKDKQIQPLLTTINIQSNMESLVSLQTPKIYLQFLVTRPS